MTDNRDLRDPQKLGEALFLHKEDVQEKLKNHYGPLLAGKKAPLSFVYDDAMKCNLTVPNYPQGESMAAVTAREYRAELEERKEAGDKYAASAIAALDKGGKVEYDDPSGN